VNSEQQAVGPSHDRGQTSTGLLLVVPCFNEQRRLRFEAFEAALDAFPISLLFVDDGSTDRTLQSIERWSAGIANVTVLALQSNGGKGEAVRHGLLAGIDNDVPFVGYIDADLATPIGEVLRMHELMRQNLDIEVVLGSRVALLGSHIERSRTRHIQGRVFATIASIALGLPVYDTQCGAKVFRTTETLRAALVQPFPSRWAFDVDLISRMLHAPRQLPPSAIVEMPLREWSDVDGSHLSLSARIQALAELFRIWRDGAAGQKRT
jgi:dolichyl-phosphate beta-glucosyltransferase